MRANSGGCCRYVSLFVSVLREFLRPEVLWFLRNPDDPDYHPFRELVEESILTHVQSSFYRLHLKSTH